MDGEPEHLYHYTTAEGLVGIVRDRKLWATDIFHLNDRREFIHGIKLAVEELQRDGIYEGYKAHVPEIVHNFPQNLCFLLMPR
jgi:hypothetical protein